MNSWLLGRSLFGSDGPGGKPCRIRQSLTNTGPSAPWAVTGWRCPPAPWGPGLAETGWRSGTLTAAHSLPQGVQAALLPMLAPLSLLSWQTGVPDPGCTAQTLGAPQQGERRQVTRLTPGSRGVDFTFFPSVCRCAPSWAPVVTFPPLPSPLTPNRR